MSAAVAAAAAKAASKPPSEDKLQAIRGKIARVRELDAELTTLMERVSAKNEEITRIRTQELPTMFQEVGILDITIDAAGNLPGYEAELVSFYSGSFPETPNEQAAALKAMPWLAELTKNRFTVDLGKGDAKKAKQLASTLTKSKIPYSNKVSVHSSTLKAELRRRTEDGKPVSPADLKLINGMVGKVVTLKQQKD